MSLAARRVTSMHFNLNTISKKFQTFKNFSSYVIKLFLSYFCNFISNMKKIKIFT